MGVDPASLAIGSLVLGGLGTGAQAIGAMKQGQATKASAEYNSEVAQENQQIATQSARQAAAAGEAQAEQAAMQSRAKVGAIVANQGASGVDVNSGSALDVRSSAQELGELNALTVRSNAARTAYGYETQATSYGAQSTLDQFEAKNALPAAEVSGAGSLLSGASDVGLNYAKFMQSQSINTENSQ